MGEEMGDAPQRPLVALDINANQSYRAAQMGILEFRIRNEAAWRIPLLEITIDCPCEHSGRKSATLKNLASASDKRQPFRFEPGRGGAALLEIQIACEGQDGMPRIYRGQTSVNVAPKEDARSSNISLDVHDLIDTSMVQRSDLRGLITIDAGKKENDRHPETLEQKQPVWVPDDLELDENETQLRREAARHLFFIPSGQAPLRALQAQLESLDPSVPLRVFFCSMPIVRFGRDTRKSDMILRYLPDFYNDERSKTISGEQFILRYSEGRCLLTLASGARAPLSVNGRIIIQQEEIPLTEGLQLKIGTHDFGLQLTCLPAIEDAHWTCSRNEVRRSNPGDDPFQGSRWDCLILTRTSNGPEERYVWLLRRVALSWEASRADSLQLGQSLGSQACLCYWNGAYYLESLDPTAELEVEGRRLKQGDLARLGQAVEISFGTLRCSWKTL
jgi:hypothetical protein